MKKLNITLQYEMTVPDDWEIVETSEGTPVLKLSDGTYMDMTMEPMFATDPEEDWSTSDDPDLLDSVFNHLDNEAVAYEFSPQ